MFKSSRPLMIIGALTLAAVGLGFYLVPSHQELALMQMNDSNFSAALKNFTTLRGEGDRSVNVIVPLINLNIYYGDVDKAISLLESYIADHPNSIEARKRLADLYKSSQRFNRYCTVLEELQKLSPSAETLRELVETYDFLGRSREEMDALEQLIDSKGYKRQENDYIRLASFYRANQQPDDATSVIRDFVKDSHYKNSVDATGLAVQLLLEQDKDEKALALTQDYLKKRKNEIDAIQLSTLFETRGHADLAIDVLTPFLEAEDHSNLLEEQIAGLMLAEKKDNDVYTLLAGRYEKEKILPPAITVMLTDLAIKRADYDMIEKLINSQDLEKLPEEALLRYTDVALRLKRVDLAHAIENKLSKSYLDEAPVLSALLGVAINDTPKTMETVLTLPGNTLVLPEGKIILANLYVQHNMPQRAFAILDNMPIVEILDTFDASLYADIYLQAGAAAKAEDILTKARDSSTPEIQNSIDQILVLLAAGEGKTGYIQQKLANFKKSDSDFWPDAFDIAIRFHRDDIALAIAEQLFKADPNITNRLQLAESLLLNHRAMDAVAIIQDFAADDEAARAFYLDAMIMRSEENGAQALSDKQKSALLTIAGLIEKNPNVSPDEKRDLAFIMDHTGFNERAEDILIALASDHPPDDPDVQDLIGYWQDHPSERGVKWLENRVHKSTVAEKAVWLSALNDMGYSQVVIDLLHNEANMPPSIADQYIAALVESHEGQKLDAALQGAIDTESNLQRIRKLAVIANEEDADSAAEKGWRKLHTLLPDDSEAAKELGMIAFNAGHYDEAEPLLVQYLQHDPADYQANYAYADILQQDEKKDEALPYYERALQQISAIKDKNVDMLVDQAYLLYQTGKLPQSIALFHELLIKHPEDKSIRADFAEMLMEAGKFEDAAALLGKH